MNEQDVFSEVSTPLSPMHPHVSNIKARVSLGRWAGSSGPAVAALWEVTSGPWALMHECRLLPPGTRMQSVVSVTLGEKSGITRA